MPAFRVYSWYLRYRIYPAVQDRRLAARRGAQCAVVVVAHTIVTITYHLLRHRTAYCELDSRTLMNVTGGRLSSVRVTVLRPEATKVTAEPANPAT